MNIDPCGSEIGFRLRCVDSPYLSPMELSVRPVKRDYFSHKGKRCMSEHMSLRVLFILQKTYLRGREA